MGNNSNYEKKKLRRIFDFCLVITFGTLTINILRLNAAKKYRNSGWRYFHGYYRGWKYGNTGVERLTL